MRGEQRCESLTSLEWGGGGGGAEERELEHCVCVCVCVCVLLLLLGASGKYLQSNSKFLYTDK